MLDPSPGSQCLKPTKTISFSNDKFQIQRGHKIVNKKELSAHRLSASQLTHEMNSNISNVDSKIIMIIPFIRPKSVPKFPSKGPKFYINVQFLLSMFVTSISILIWIHRFRLFWLHKDLTLRLLILQKICHHQISNQLLQIQYKLILTFEIKSIQFT